MTVERGLRAVLLESECLPSHFVLSVISDLQLTFPSDRLRGQVASRRGYRSCISRQPLSIGFQFFHVYVRTLYGFLLCLCLSFSFSCFVLFHTVRVRFVWLPFVLSRKRRRRLSNRRRPRRHRHRCHRDELDVSLKRITRTMDSLASTVYSACRFFRPERREI